MGSEYQPNSETSQSQVSWEKIHKFLKKQLEGGFFLFLSTDG